MKKVLNDFITAVQTGIFALGFVLTVNKEPLLYPNDWFTAFALGVGVSYFLVVRDYILEKYKRVTQNG